MLGGVLDFFFPRRCILCGNSLVGAEKKLCCTCLWDMPFITGEEPLSAAQRVFWGRCRIEAVWPLFYYVNPYKEIVHRIKYGSDIALALQMGRMLGARIASDVLLGKAPPIDYIVPVPLHWRRRLKRGYNQTAEISKGIRIGYSEVLPGGASLFTHLLYRRSATATQTRKNRHQRWLNVKDAFGVRSGAGVHRKIDGRHLLLVDDVLTTGATLDACANSILEHFCCRVSIATLGFVP